MLPLKQISNKKNLNLIIREYSPKDSDSLIQLENEAPQTRFTLFGLLSIGKIFGAPFDAKCKKYKDYIILVVEHIINQGNSRICAGASVGIKDIYFNKNEVRAGYLFDLRVSEHYQRLGIGQALSQCLEEVAKARGCQMLFLGVNKANLKAVNLYEKMGFVKISERKVGSERVQMKEIHPPEEEKRVFFEGAVITVRFNRLDETMAAEYLTKFYKEQDLALQDYAELTKSRSYEGTYVAESEDGTNIVGVSLVKVGNENLMGFKKFIVPSSCFLQRWCNGCFIALILACIIPLMLKISSAIGEAIDYDERLSDFLAILVFFVIGWGITVLLLIGFDFLKVTSGYETKGRVTAPFAFGESKYKRFLFSLLNEELHNICRGKNIRHLVLNVDSQDAVTSYWKSSLLKKRSFGLFMAKALNASINLNQRKRTDCMYFDPRDF